MPAINTSLHILIRRTKHTCQPAGVVIIYGIASFSYQNGTLALKTLMMFRRYHIYIWPNANGDENSRASRHAALPEGQRWISELGQQRGPRLPPALITAKII